MTVFILNVYVIACCWTNFYIFLFAMWVDYGEGLIFCCHCHKFWLLCLHAFKIILICSDEGKVRKILKLEPLPDGSGHFFNLSNTLSSWSFVAIIILILFRIHIYVSGTLCNVLGSLSPLHIVETASSSHSDALFQNWSILVSSF